MIQRGHRLRKWWRRRRKNRRIPSSDQLNLQRSFLSLFFAILKPTLSIGLVLLVGVGVWQGIKRSHYFKMKRIIIAGEKQLSDREVLMFAGIDYTQNLIIADLRKIYRHLKRHPRIQDVRLYREMPSTLRIVLKFRQPAAIVRLGADYLIDELGRPFARIRRDDKRYRSLLLITGLQRQQYEQARTTSQKIFRQAMAIVDLYRQKKLHKYQKVQEIQYDALLGYILHCGKNRIYLGGDHYEKRLERLALIYQLVGSQAHRRLKYVYLNNIHHPNRVTIRLAETTSPIHKESSTKKM